MSEYGSGVSLVQAFNYDKDRLLHALNGELLCGETEDGFVYCDAPEENCKEFIVSVFDNAVYHALQGYQSGRVYEKVMEAHGFKVGDGQIFKDYMHFKTMDDLAQKEHYNFGTESEDDDD